jgi:hypothetical protein
LRAAYFVALDWKAEWRVPFLSPLVKGGVVSDLSATVLSKLGFVPEISVTGLSK